MDDVIRYPGDPPGYGHAPLAYEQIRDRAEHSEKKPEKTGQQAIKYVSGLMSFGIPYDKDQQRPYVQIHDRPYINPLKKAFNSCKSYRDKECISADTSSVYAFLPPDAGFGENPMYISFSTEKYRG